MRLIQRTSQFKKDIKLIKKRAYKLEKLFEVIEILAVHGEISTDHRPHKLSGNWQNFWECHIQSDWLLIYLIDEEYLTLVRTGTHSDLFN